MEMWGWIRAFGKWGKTELFVQFLVPLAGGAAECPCDFAFILSPQDTPASPQPRVCHWHTQCGITPRHYLHLCVLPQTRPKPLLKSHLRARGNPPDLSQGSAGGLSLGDAPRGMSPLSRRSWRSGARGARRCSNPPTRNSSSTCAARRRWSRTTGCCRASKRTCTRWRPI